MRQCERCLEELQPWASRHTCRECKRKVCVCCWNKTDKLCGTCDLIEEDGRDLGAKRRSKQGPKKSRGG